MYNLMRKISQMLTLLFTTSLFMICCGQKQSQKIEVQTKNYSLKGFPKLKKIVNDIAKGNSVESSHIGEGGSPSKQYAKYEELKKNATETQLIELTENSNSAVRCFAFQALASKKSEKTFSILLKHLKDTTLVKTQSGCIIMTQLVGDYFIDVVTPYYIDKEVYKLNNNERKKLDSILLNDRKIKLSAKYSVLKNLAPTEENYKRIRELVEIDKNTSALITLAKYKKQEDKKLISSFFNDENSQFSALYAVREFPDDYFYPFILEIFDNEWKQERYDYPKWRICYQTLAKYPKPETIERFEKTTNTKDEFRYQTLCKYLIIAIKKYPNNLYEPFKQKIKLEEYSMDEVKNELEKNN
jgi:hypothetical protein